MTNSSILEIRNLSVRYPTVRGHVRAVEDVSFQIERQEVVALVGESGCGKTTLSLTIPRLLDVEIVSGEIIFKGEDLLKKDDKAMREIRGKNISVVFQDPFTSFNPTLTVGWQVFEAIRIHYKLQRTEVKMRAVGLLKGVGIPDAEKRLAEYPYELSGGMRQRAMIAMALACQPDLLIADEPTSNLDVTIQAQVLEMLKETSKKSGLSILYVSHDLATVFEIADKIGVMYAGKIVEFSDKRDLFADPQHPYTRALLSCMPRVDRRLTLLESIPGKPPDLIEPPPGCVFHPRCVCVSERCKKGDMPVLKKVSKNHWVACPLTTHR